MSQVSLHESTLGLGAGSVTEESQRWFDRAKKVLAGGISSSARSVSTGPLPYPLYITHGRGSRIWDADGNEFIDYLCSYGSCILGHTDPGTDRSTHPANRSGYDVRHLQHRREFNWPNKSAEWCHVLN